MNFAINAIITSDRLSTFINKNKKQGKGVEK